MSDLAIRVEHLSKRYRLGEREPYKSLRDVLARAATAPFSQLGGKTKANDGHEYIWALEDVSFEVHQGEAVGIIGRNGAGKSTLLKVLSRITKPTKGRAEIYGRVGSLLEVGTGFHPELTGRENIYLNGAILGMKRQEIERKFDEIVAFAEIEKFLDTPVKRYSSGMYVRLAFAVAAHLEPEILLVDEVLAVGDAAFQKKCLGKMGEVVQEGRTVLFVSHNMAAVKMLCKSGIFLEDGKNICNDIIENVVEKYIQGSLEQEFSGILESSMHLINTNEFYIHRVSLVNTNGESISQFKISEKVRVNIYFEVTQFVKQVRIGIGFNTQEGVRISTLHHTDQGLNPIDIDKGFYEISMDLINPLLPGTYILSVGAHRSLAGITIDYVPEALRFTVLDISADNEHYVAYNHGLVQFSALWQQVHPILKDEI